jgi:hypothetical protein
MKKCLNILLINVQKHCNLRDEMYSVPTLHFPVEDVFGTYADMKVSTRRESCINRKRAHLNKKVFVFIGDAAGTCSKLKYGVSCFCFYPFVPKRKGKRREKRNI